MNNCLSIIVLVRNEEIHISRCLNDIFDLNCDVFVVDSSSDDATKEIVQEYKHKCHYYNFDADTFGEKLNWAIDNLPIKSKWTMRLDADEILTPEFKENIFPELNKLAGNVGGIYINRRHHFMGRWIKYGGMHPKKALRIWRTDGARCETKLLDEQMICDNAETVKINLDIIDDNLNNLTMWIAKHNNYSNREAISNDGMNKIESNFFGSQPERLRWLKTNIYEKTPLFLGPFAYFIYRYFFRLGFLDGKEGLIWHFLHALWYRFLVDAKKYEMSVTNAKYKSDFKNIYK